MPEYIPIDKHDHEALVSSIKKNNQGKTEFGLLLDSAKKIQHHPNVIKSSAPNLNNKASLKSAKKNTSITDSETITIKDEQRRLVPRAKIEQDSRHNKKVLIFFLLIGTLFGAFGAILLNPSINRALFGDSDYSDLGKKSVGNEVGLTIAGFGAGAALDIALFLMYYLCSNCECPRHLSNDYNKLTNNSHTLIDNSSENNSPGSTTDDDNIDSYQGYQNNNPFKLTYNEN